jgi:hypothetical protein
MRKVKLWILSCLIVSIAYAQDPEVQVYGNTISELELKDNLSILASDALEGRETGKRGQKMAAAFIKAYFEELGLNGPVNGDYYQAMELYTTSAGKSYVKVSDARFNNFTDVTYYGNDDSGGEVSVQLVFAGDGSDDALQNVDIKDKAVLLVASENFPGNEELEALRSKGAKMIFVSHSKTKADFNIVSNQVKALAGSRELTLKKPLDSNVIPGVFLVSPSMVEKFFGMTREQLVKVIDGGYKKSAIKKIKPVQIKYMTSKGFQPVQSENVLGFLEGSDKKEEVIVITAHYDHVGKKEHGEGDLIHNGADDDGSGTVAVMQIAKAFAQAKLEGKGPRRSILFMLVTAEEKGLLGSLYYTQNPVFPLRQTVVNLNIDMIGRRDPQHRESSPYVYVIGADKLSSELHEISEATNKLYTNLIFDYTYNDVDHPDRLYYRSDHWNFAKNNIPVIFYFDGIHEDYHKPSDEIDKIEFDLLKKRTQCIFYTAWEIANREKRIALD